MSYHYQDHRAGAGFSGPTITWAVQRLIFITVTAFVLQLLVDPFMAILAPLGPPAAVPPGGIINDYLGFRPGHFLTGWLWMPLTYMFLHDGVLHLFMNMLWLFFFGPEVERTLGSRQFVRFYLICGAGGVLFTCLPFILDGQNIPVIGASGAAMGVLVAFVMIDPQRQFFLFPFPVPINALMLFLIVVVLNVFTALTSSATSVVTHFGGMGVAFLYMKFMPQINIWLQKRRLRKPPKPPTGNTEDPVGRAVDNIFDFDKHKKP